MRDKLLNIPDRVATLVAAERDPARVHQVMTAELKRVLHELSDDAEPRLPEGLPSAWLLDCNYVRGGDPAGSGPDDLAVG
jgi:hypothetical protein